MLDEQNLREEILVRCLQSSDLESMVLVDQKSIGRRREEYLKLKLESGLTETGIAVSLAAEPENRFAGFLIARVFYGEFGMPEQVAVLDTIGVHPDFRHKGVAKALLGQLKKNLLCLGITQVQTEVSWEAQSLLSFFQHEGFKPAARFCLDLNLDSSSI